MGIFIVDDSAVSRRLVAVYVRELKLGSIEEFASAEAVLARLRNINPYEIKAILLDIMMPGMDGVECCLRIRSMPGYAETPILLVTAIDDEMNMMLGFEAGATDYIKKPILKHELKVRLHNSVQLHEERRRRRLVEMRLQQDVAVAQEVQQRMLTSRISDEYFGMRLLYRPAAKLSGDMVFVCPVGKRRYTALLIDVMGHGVTSALIAMLLQASARDLMLQQLPPGEILAALSLQMWDLASVRCNQNTEGIGQFPNFFSAVCLDLNLDERCLRWANAGHVPVLVRAGETEIFQLESDEPPLGLMPIQQPQTKVLPLEGQIRLLAYSDGVIDNFFPSATAGIGFLSQTLAEHSSASLDVFLAQMDASLVSRQPSAELDDLCVMAIDIDLRGN